MNIQNQRVHLITSSHSDDVVNAPRKGALIYKRPGKGMMGADRNSIDIIVIVLPANPGTPDSEEGTRAVPLGAESITLMIILLCVLMLLSAIRPKKQSQFYST